MTLRRMTDPFRSVLFNILFYVSSLLYLALVVIAVLAPSRRPTKLAIRGYCGMCLFWARWIMGIKCEWRGGDLLPPEGTPIILVAAHQSYSDPMLAYRLREDVTALAKKELFNTPMVGAMISKMGVIRVDRQKGGTSESMRDVADQLNREGQMMIVYPQATRARPGEHRRLKSGAYVMAQAADVPVYTVATNTGAMWSRGFWHHSGTCVFEVVRKIDHNQDKDSFMKQIEEDIVLRSEKLTIEAGFADLVEETQRRQAENSAEKTGEQDRTA